MHRVYKLIPRDARYVLHAHTCSGYMSFNFCVGTVGNLVHTQIQGRVSDHDRERVTVTPIQSVSIYLVLENQFQNALILYQVKKENQNCEGGQDTRS